MHPIYTLVWGQRQVHEKYNLVAVQREQELLLLPICLSPCLDIVSIVSRPSERAGTRRLQESSMQLAPCEVWGAPSTAHMSAAA
jgi:hypothetical protein